MNRSGKFVLLYFLLFVLNACQSPATDEVLTESTNALSQINIGKFEYVSVNFPAFFGMRGQGPGNNAVLDNDNMPEDNPITNAGATLGRVLFYDKQLSKTNIVSCASCHHQANGFSDTKVQSDGFAGGKTRRHSMSLTNARFYESGRFFWDERAATLEDQVLMPIQDEVEMGLSLETLISKVQNQAFYAPLFRNAFGDENITSDRISKALAQFVRSLVSFESKYDVGRAKVNNPNEDFPNFTPAENLGKRIFFGRGQQGGDCARCHATDAMITPANGPFNNGLDATSTTDLGVFETTQNRGDLGKFKSPSLRNIGVSAPYMHDGRFQTLAQVIEHYNSGVQNHPNLDPGLRNQNGGGPRRLNLSNTEKLALEAFLNTLTDTNFLQNEKFSDPF